MLDSVWDMQQLLDEAKVNAEKFDAGNKAAGKRLRKNMQDIKELAQAIRVGVLEGKDNG